MTDEEKKIYNTLPDAASKRAFIKEFWKIRDPDPSTEENENRIEFGNWETFDGRSMGNCRRYELSFTFTRTSQNSGGEITQEKKIEGRHH